ncbi:dihydrofolate reductase [Clostridium botulinum]|uniref:Dihydrofolate reductase n=1 Tax=Clostridium botulinum (strain Eklund 17B / Type B) TaxID=935198 RepID=B2TR57_CLOBB|nr:MULTISPECIES: dihydrofolate reductase [unclassified Clostridium]ACD24845.1 dihydrofolate reductase [Clostridium botulinum B str. Eklund 17B (NRP)]AIY79838.1 dihydrofolate reductase family protein [Clostridium botulinum 202F]KAI3344832.1 dihydrofolate reductase [Clostridium botulinum]KFX54437.1 diacylglycerol kinase [Clostridium botulinum]KFX59277.1 diacylglycerol kinase [Clostridium botulinum]
MLSIIVAIAKNNVIGNDNKLIWHISEDLKRFKEITSGKTIVMGRKTFESLPGVLPNRKHIILTRDKNFKVNSECVEIIYDFDELLNKYKNSDDEVFIIGGGEIYKQLLPYSNKLYLTKINKDFDGDTYFPQINYNDFKIDYESDVITDEKSGLEYKFINLSRLS